MKNRNLAILLMVVVILMFGFSSLTNAQALTKVNFGLLPYQDWMPWALGQELGYFAEEGIELDFTKFPDDVTVGEALVSGDIDVGCTNSSSGVLLSARFPELRTISLACGFTGYAIMVRPTDVYPDGKYKTYEQFYEEYLNESSPEEASERAIYDTCRQLKGATIVMDRGTGSNLPLSQALKVAELKTDDINYIDIPDVEGALGFWQGTGDFELGGYPQVISLTKLGAKKLISARELGGSAVILSGEMARNNWIENNMDTIVKMRKAWYRVIDDIYELEGLKEKFAEVANKWQGTNLTVEDVDVILEEVTYWPRKDEILDYFFAPDAKWNAMNIYQTSLDFWVNIAEKVEPGKVDLDKFLIADEIHKKL